MDSISRYPFPTLLAVASILAITLAIRLYLFVGINGADDISIANHAIKLLSEGPYIPHSHYSSRVGLIYPLAMLFAVFGVNEWSIALIPLISSLGGVWLTYLIGSHYAGMRVGIFAALLLALFPLDAYFASQLMPDLPLGSLLALSYYLLIRSGQQQAPTLFLPILAGVFWGWAYLVKVEAFFFSFVVLGLFLSRQLSWRNSILVYSSVAVVVASEHIIYWFVSGDFLLRLHLATYQGGGQMVEAFSATQLWVFPKSWFLTPYFFSVHYYMLFAAILWAVWTRPAGMLPIFLWIVIFLLWLQFGGNPFSSNYSVKSHLARYCNMLNVPMAILIARFIFGLGEGLAATVAPKAATAAVVLGAAILLPFNQLSAERQIATKQLLDIARSENLFPLYLDRTSYSLAEAYLYEEMKEGKLHNLQVHNFKTMESRLMPIETIQGHVLINRGFVDYGFNRYRVSKIQYSDFQDRFTIHSVADNPSSGVSYASARLLRWAAQLIPIARFRDKVLHTTDSVLEGNDAVLLSPGVKSTR